MALIDSLRSRFKGGGAKKKEEQTVVPEAVEQQAPPKPEAPPPPPQRELVEMRLPGEHPICKLQDLYTQQVGGERLPPPCLSLEPVLEQVRSNKGPAYAANGEPTVVLTEDEAKQELEKLAEMVERTAAKRLADIEEQRTIAATRAAERAAKSTPKGQEPPPPPSPSDMPPPDMDADVQVFVTGRRMTAWLLCYPPVGKGAELNQKILERTLGTAQVIAGIDESLFKALPTMPERYFTLHLIAVGAMPVHGKDGSVIDLFPREQVQTLKEDEVGRVDFAAIEIFQNVHEGDMICRITYPTEPVNGRTVQGQVLSARPGRAPAVPKGRNTQLSEDKSSLVASCDGHVEFSGNAFQVKSVMEIPGNVDFSTGNISSVGDVHIHGDVCSGFAVKATGNVTVDGVIEACSVETGGDLVVRKGVQGNGEAVLRVRRNVFAKYMESTTVYVRENVEAESLISCKVYCDKDVIIRSGRGTIVGGEIHAAHDVSANIVGSRAELLTSIYLGGRPYEDFERVELMGLIEELEQELEKLDRQPDSPVKLQRMSKVRMLIAANKLKLRQLDKEIGEMEDDPEQEAAPARGRLSGGVIYPGTEINIGAYVLRVAHETHSCVTTIADGEIKLI